MESEDSDNSCDEPNTATVTTVKKDRPPRIQTKTAGSILTVALQAVKAKVYGSRRGLLACSLVITRLTLTTTERRRIIKHRHRPLLNLPRQRKRHRQEKQPIQIVTSNTFGRWNPVTYWSHQSTTDQHRLRPSAHSFETAPDTINGTVQRSFHISLEHWRKKPDRFCGTTYLKWRIHFVTALLLRHCELEFSVAPSFLQGLTIPRKKSNAQLTVNSHDFFIRIKTKRQTRTDKQTKNLASDNMNGHLQCACITDKTYLTYSSDRSTKQVNHSAGYSKSPDCAWQQDLTKPAAKFTKHLMTILRQFYDILHTFANVLIHETSYAVSYTHLTLPTNREV